MRSTAAAVRYLDVGRSETGNAVLVLSGGVFLVQGCATSSCFGLARE